jgi:carbon monoxide dehydrogenase subunit G
MAFEIVKKFVVKAEPEAVWSFLTDPEKVASCLPGAAITGKLDDQTWQGTMNLKVGPVQSSYKGRIHFDMLDPASKTAELSATGQETKGKGGADMKMKSVVRKNDAGETEVTATSQVNITGILAQMGRGMIQDVSDQMFQIFSQRLRAQLETAPEAGAASAPPPASTAASLTAAAALSAEAPATGTARTPTSISRPAAPVPAPEPPASIAPRAPAKPEVLDVGAIGARAAKNAAARSARNPLVWVAVVALVVVLYLLFR